MQQLRPIVHDLLRRESDRVPQLPTRCRSHVGKMLLHVRPRAIPLISGIWRVFYHMHRLQHDVLVLPGNRFELHLLRHQSPLERLLLRRELRGCLSRRILSRQQRVVHALSLDVRNVHRRRCFELRHV